jgi:chemotaxis response regulator CheB
MIRVLIADDEAPTRASMRQLLASHADIEVAGEAESGVEAMEMAARLRPA